MDSGLSLTETFWDHRDEVEAFLESGPGLIYSSSDVRDSGFRASVVDVNVFPAGFNNIRDLSRTSEFFRQHLEENNPGIETVGILPESHTKNTYYFENVASLRAAIAGAGYDAEVVTPDDRLCGAEFTGAGGSDVSYHSLDEVDPDLVVLNNDLSDGPLADLEEEGYRVTPPQAMGWWNRSKGHLFSILESEARDLAEVLGIDPWRIAPETRRVEDVDVESGDLTDLAETVEDVLSVTEEKYREYGVSEELAVFVKDDRGTYGQGTMVVRDPSEILNLSNRKRKSMAVGKGGHDVTSVVVQEGIPTRFEVDGQVAEPVQYVVGRGTAGSFWRCRGKKRLSVLNNPGQRFRGDGKRLSDEELFLHDALARLGHRAAAIEAGY